MTINRRRFLSISAAAAAAFVGSVASHLQADGGDSSGNAAIPKRVLGKTGSTFPVRNGQTFLMIGDSITDCGRTKDVAPYGLGYVRAFMDIVAKRHPDLDVNWINEGMDGHNVHNLRARWHKDVLDIRPDWLSIMVGINDAAGRRAEPLDSAVALFRTDYVEILRQLRSFSPRIALIDPFLIATPEFLVDADAVLGKAFYTPIAERLSAYIAVVDELADDVGALHVRTHQMFSEQLRYRPPEYFCSDSDPVHPNPTGHLMIAMELYDTLVGA